MHRWMDERGLTQEKLEGLVAEMAQLAALRNRVTAGRVDEYFAAHRTEFDTVSFAQFAVADVERARRIADEIREGTIDFYAAAEQIFREGGPTAGDLFVTVRRGKVSAELAAAPRR